MRGYTYVEEVWRLGFLEHVSGDSAPEIFLGTGNSTDRGRLHWDRAGIVCTHRQPTLSR